MTNIAMNATVTSHPLNGQLAYECATLTKKVISRSPSLVFAAIKWPKIWTGTAGLTPVTVRKDVSIVPIIGWY